MPNRDSVEARSLQGFSNVIDVTPEPSLACVSLGLRVDRAPFNDPRVRGAADLALDRAALIRDIAFGNGDILGAVNPHLAGGFWSLPEAEVLEAHSGAAAIEERRQDARALLQAAGAAGASFTLEVANIPQMIDVATVVRQQLLTLGLDVVMRELDLLHWFTNFRRGQFDATVIGHLPYESPDTPTRFYHSAGPDGTTNMFGFADGEIDPLVERSWGETDRAARQKTLLDAQRLMLKARPMIQLFTSTGYSTAWKRVRNRHPELIGSAAQYNYEQWLASP
jgi:peptide/nickel transport system substrate-binding protein